jgi:hypothetical protein
MTAGTLADLAGTLADLAGTLADLADTLARCWPPGRWWGSRRDDPGRRHVPAELGTPP